MSCKYHLFRFTFFSSRSRLLLFLSLFLLPTIACGLVNTQYRSNNEIRLAIYQYERRERDSVDDLVIYFKRDEPRVRFEGQNAQGGRTIWLYNLGAEEYFALRSPEATYLFIQSIDYSENRNAATVSVYRGNGGSYTGRRLTLVRDDNGGWAVTDETLIPGTASNEAR